jgi:prepilin-type N-terminal cleavage/methylation domain-containing protein
MKFLKRKKNKGFTLIEVMVSVAIFSIVITAGMGALMTVLGSHKFSQQEKKASDAMSYIIENITREIRLGYTYYVGPGDIDDPPDGFVNNGMIELSGDGNLIGFFASDNRGYIIYYLRDGVLMKRSYTDGGMIDGALSDKEQIIIKEARVTVMNAGDDSDQRQPLVWLQLKMETPGTNKMRVLQTLISQRTLDVH